MFKESKLIGWCRTDMEEKHFCHTLSKITISTPEGVKT